MPRFTPFAGIRYGADDLALVTAPPYDVIDAEERAALAAQHDHNVVRIDLPVGGADPYADAGALFAGWRTDGVLVTDEPTLYLYRMTFTDEQPFLDAIFARYHDDGPRLVYADFLDAAGDPERAELVRVQLALARLTEDHPRRPSGCRAFQPTQTFRPTAIPQRMAIRVILQIPNSIGN